MNSTFWIEQIAATKALILAYNDAILAVTANPMLSYSLDTGQSKQTVTYQNLSSLQTQYDSLLNRLVTLEARVCGSGVYVVPAF